MAKKPKGEGLELRVADAYRKMGARKVEHDVQLAGNQIDVYVEQEAPDHTVHRIAIEAKDWKKAVGIGVVNDFAGIVKLLLDKHLVHEGIIVSEKGFTKQGREAAATHGIRLLEVADLDALVAQAAKREEAAGAIKSPHTLPSPPADFVGRDGELQKLHAAVDAGRQGVIISCLGMGGVGKTALALQLAHDIKERYPDERLFLELAGTSDHPLTPAEAMAQVIRAYRPPLEKLPETVDELAPLYRSVLADRKVLILADNAADDKQVRPLIPPPSCLLMITTRNRFALPGCQDLELKTLPPDKARELLLRIAPRIGGHADSIAKSCGCLPLALRAAASLVAVTADLDPGRYARDLADERTRLEKIGKEGVDMGVEATFNLSYARLAADAASVFRRLAVFPASATFTPDAEEAVCEDSGHKHLSALLRMSMVEFDETKGRYGLHDLVRIFADRRLTDPAERTAAHRRHAAHYGLVAESADKVFLGKEPDSNVRGLALFDREWENIHAGRRWSAANAAGDAEAARLCSAYPNAAVYCLFLRIHARDWIGWLESALAAARRIKERKAEGIHLVNLGIAYAALGETPRAIEFYEKALIIDHEIGNRRSEGNALCNLGNAHMNLGETRRAIESYEKARTIHREIGDRRGEGADLGNLGIGYAALGETRRAIEFYEKQLAIVCEIGDRLGEGAALGNLGNACADLGETRRAIEFYEKRLVIAREIGDRRGEGITLWNMALALDELNQRPEAIRRAGESLAIREAIEDPDAAKVRRQLAEWRKA